MKPISVVQAKKNIMIYLENMAGYKTNYFKGMSYDDIRPIFEVEYNKVQTLFKSRDVDKDKEELQGYLTIMSDDEGLDVASLVTNAMLYDFDRQDVLELYKLVKERLQSESLEGYDLLLWGDLKIMMEPNAEHEIWKNQQDWNLRSWKLHKFCGVHVLLMQDEHDESMLDVLRIIPQCKQHKKLLLKALVGEDSGEKQEGTAFEKQSALFALSISDIMLINMLIKSLAREASTAAAAPKCCFSNVLVLKEVSHYCLGTRMICAASVYFMLLMQDLMLPIVISYVNAAIDTTAIGFKRRSPGCIFTLTACTLGLGPGCIFTLTTISKWECSSYGRALALYARERFYTSARNPVKEILFKLNLPDHRKLKDGGEGSDDENPPPPPSTPTQQTPHIMSTIKLSILKKGEYDIWAIKMDYLAHTDYPIWEVIQTGNGPVCDSIDTNRQIKVLPLKTIKEVLAREKERKAMTTLLMAIPEDHLAKFHKMTDAKKMWEAIKSRFGGND
ncbi:ribonuclease H-like domain-containing protein [Tanacetum coccineum]